MKILNFFLLALIISSCTLQKKNIEKSTLQVVYYASLYDIENIGTLKFYTKHSLKDILRIKKDSESSHIKAYYTNKGALIKAEKFKGDKALPSRIYWINENNINYKTRRYEGKTYSDCNLSYRNKGNFRIRTTICDDGTKEVHTTQPGRIFISYLKYDKSGHTVEKRISTKKGIEVYENGKLIEIRNEIE